MSFQTCVNKQQIILKNVSAVFVKTMKVNRVQNNGRQKQYTFFRISSSVKVSK